MNPPSCPAFPFADPKASHLVHDPVTGDAVIIAPGRRYRPDGISKPVFSDPFSPSGLKREHVLKVYRGAMTVTAIENAYPIFHQDRPLDGRQEILVEGSRKRPFTTFSVVEITATLKAMQDRCRVFRKDRGLKCMIVFKNEGKEAGASQPHPHSQIFGLPFVPDRLVDIARRHAALSTRHKMTMHEKLLAEATEGRRIYSDKNAFAFADPASRFAYGVRITTRRAIDNLTQARPAEIVSLAKAIHALLPLLRERELAFCLSFHDVFADRHECFEMRLSPRANVWGGFELDAGIVVNPVPAECAATEYRSA